MFWLAFSPRRWYKVEFPQTSTPVWWSSICPSPSLGIRVESSIALGSREIIHPFYLEGTEKWKGRLSHPAWEVKKLETGDGVTEGGREEVYAFFTYFISSFGHQVSWISGDALETRPNLRMVSYKGLTQHIQSCNWWVVTCECNSPSLISSVFEGRDSPSFSGESGKRQAGISTLMEIEAVVKWRQPLS